MTLTGTNRLLLTVFLGIMAAMAPLSTDMYLPALPVMQADFNISTSLTQMTLTMTMIGMALGQIFAGPISDMRGRKRPLFIGMLVFIVATVGCVVITNIWLFLICRFIAGFAGASGIVIARAIARDVCEGAELTRFFAMLMMVNGLAPILAPVIGGQILAFTTWHGVFILLAVIGVAQAVATLIYRETLPPEKRLKNLAASFHKFPELIKNRYFFGHCLLQCFAFGAFFSYIAGSSFVFQNVFGLSAQAYSLAFGIIGVGLMLSGSIPARFAGRVPDELMLRGSIFVPLIGSICLLSMALLKVPLVIFYPFLFITLVPQSIMGATSFSLALAKQGKNAGSASALIGFFSMILGGVMMPLVGIAGDNTAVPMLILMILGYGGANVVFHTYILPEHQEKEK
ncbi:MAG: multidrug effflux MFS transporter [Selenomonadaceae bacterium]|nr:multidrug effflux MFS transporter [Selenomonadaceae bacterium]